MSNWVNLVKYFLIKDIKARYVGSGLGTLWAFVLPVFQILLYWFVFSSVMRIRPYSSDQIPYVYYLLSTFFFWLAISEGISRSGTVLIENAELVKKVSFPTTVLPVSVTLSGYLLHMIGAILAILIFAFSGLSHIYLVFIIPVLFLQVVFSIGSGMLMAAVVPYMRDIHQVIGYALQGMFFLSPIIYPLDAIPEHLRGIAFLNPVTVYVESYHKIIFEQQIPGIHYILGMIFISVVFLSIGLRVFHKLSEGFADIL
jgi:ABC-type polysaccharide/polyol phosphate export permease